MTKNEALRQTHQENTLLELGFTRQEAEQLRRISMTLHRWHELECGMDPYCLVRGRWNQAEQTFEYDDDGRPYLEWANGSGRRRYSLVPDKERGAQKRLNTLIGNRNARVKPADGQTRIDPLGYHIQTDPRGAALYLLRPGDVPEGKSAESYYTRGICIY